MSQYLTGLNLLDPGVKRYNGGGTSFSMDDNDTTNGTLLWVDGVAQVPGTDYNGSGATITTTSSTPSGTNNVVSLQLFSTGIINTPGDDTVATAKIQNDAVTLAKMAAGTDGNIISYDASGDPVAIATGNDGQVLHSAGAGQPPAFETLTTGLTLATEQATTSGTDVTFSSIPAGTKMIFIMWEALSYTANGINTKVEIGDSGGLETSGYESNSNDVINADNLDSTAAFVFKRTSAAAADHGTMCLVLKDSSNFTWNAFGMLADSTLEFNVMSGVKSLSAELTQLKVTSSGTFDAGSVNISYM